MGRGREGKAGRGRAGQGREGQGREGTLEIFFKIIPDGKHN